MELVKRTILVLFVGISLLRGGNTQTVDDTMRLISNLTSNYDTRIRPVINQTDTVDIVIRFSFMSLQEFDDLTGLVSFQALTHLAWREERMTWNPADFGNLTFLLLKATDVWKPKMTMLNAPDHHHLPGLNAELVNVSFTGELLMSSMDWLQTVCSVDIRHYPFDIQTCLVSIIPWHYDYSSVRFIATNTTRVRSLDSVVVENSAWKVEMTQPTSVVVEGVSTVQIFLSCTRRHKYAVLNLITPLLTIAFLNTWVFLLPPESGERVSFSITVLLSIVLYMGILDDNVPKGSEPLSHLTELLCVMLFYSASLLFWTIVSLRIYSNADNETVPKYIQQMVSCLLLKNFRKKQHLDESDEVINVADKEENMKKFDGAKPLQAWDQVDVKVAEPVSVTWVSVGKMFDLLVFLAHIVWWTVLMLQVYNLSNTDV